MGTPLRTVGVSREFDRFGEASLVQIAEGVAQVWWPRKEHGELGRGEWPAEAVAVLKKAADAGSAAAARELAHVHHYGLAGYSVDVERAHALYSAAAAEGDASAQAEIGFMYAAGTAPGGADVARAGINLYFAASAGDVDAQVRAPAHALARRARQRGNAAAKLRQRHKAHTERVY